jgi:hypothetical protein
MREDSLQESQNIGKLVDDTVEDIEDVEEEQEGCGQTPLLQKDGGTRRNPLVKREGHPSGRKLTQLV